MIQNKLVILGGHAMIQVCICVLFVLGKGAEEKKRKKSGLLRYQTSILGSKKGKKKVGLVKDQIFHVFFSFGPLPLSG